MACLKNKLSIIRFLVVILYSSFFCSCFPSVWKVYQPKGMDCSIEMPNLVEEKTTNINSQLGLLEHHQFFSKNWNIVFGISYIKFPENKSKTYNADDFIGGDSGPLGDFFSGQILIDRSISFNGYPGREIYIRVQTDDYNGTMIQRFYAINNVMYILQVITPQRKIFSKNIKYFFDTFKLLKNDAKRSV